MTQDEIRAIAHEEIKKMAPWPSVPHAVMVELCFRFLAAINAKAEPVALYPCGFKNLHSMVIEKGAFLARNLNEDEPVTDGIHSAAMALVGYAKDMSTLLAKQPLYTHPAIEPAPQESRPVTVCDAKRKSPVGAAPLPDAQLCKFYDVDNFPDLVSAMDHHIEKLQSKLPPTPSLWPGRVREG